MFAVDPINRKISYTSKLSDDYLDGLKKIYQSKGYQFEKVTDILVNYKIPEAVLDVKVDHLHFDVDKWMKFAKKSGMAIVTSNKKN